MTETRLYLSRPHMSGTERQHVEQAFDSNFVAPLGPKLNEFEETVASYLGEGVHCAGLSSGSAALHLALLMAGVGRGEDVWISSMTFAGGIFPVSYLGATPVFFDLDPNHWTLDAQAIADALETASRANRLPKAIIPTDLYGQSVDLDVLEAAAAKHGVSLIVDSAESLGAAYRNGRKCGTGGDSAILSFNGNKIITTSGGGMFVSKNAKLVERARFLSTQARDPAPHFQHSEIGFNYRLSNICAAIGVGQMEVLDQRVHARRAIRDRYREALQPLGVMFLPEPDGYHSSCWLTATLVDPAKVGVTREDIRLMLGHVGIESRPLWKPMHMQPVFKGAKYLGAGFDEALFKDGLCLPSGSDMTLDQQSEVIERITDMIGKV